VQWFLVFEALASLSLRLKDLLGPVTRVKKKTCSASWRMQAAQYEAKGSAGSPGEWFRVWGLGFRV